MIAVRVYSPRDWTMQTARAVVYASKSSVARFSCCKVALYEISNEVHGSNIWWRGISYAASAPSDSSKPQRGKKRLSKHEKRALVKSFIDKYRAMNAGKFPSVSLTQAQFGGSYYVIRDIVQSIEYEYRKSPVSKNIEAVVEKTEKPILPHFDVKEESVVSTGLKVSASFTTAGSISPDLSLDMKEKSSMEIFDTTKLAKEEPQISIPVDKVKNEEVVAHVTRVRSPLDEPVRKGTETVHIEGHKSYSWSEMGTEKKVVCHQKFPDKSLDNISRDSNEDPATVQIDSITEKPAATPSKASRIQDSSVHHPISAGSEMEAIRLPEDVESSGRVEMASRVSYGLKGESVLKDGHQSDQSQRDTSKRMVPEEELPPEKLTVWGNLKSLADGFINFWKKM